VTQWGRIAIVVGIYVASGIRGRGSSVEVNRYIEVAATTALGQQSEAPNAVIKTCRRDQTDAASNKTCLDSLRPSTL
jgi:CelD/BcsL family acetyltransferase involved in cellulose biosynthesis